MSIKESGDCCCGGKMIKVLCNSNLTNYSDNDIIFLANNCANKGSLKISKIIKLIKKDKIDALLLFNPGIREILLCFIARKFIKIKVFLFDATLKKPRNFLESPILLLKGVMINSCNKFIAVHKDLTEYYKYYSINKNKVVYVPFKSNCYEIIDSIKVEDDGYILSCGASHRDYDTLIKAAQDIDKEVIIVLPHQVDALHHKSKLNSNSIPNNVRIVRHDFSRNSWYEYLRKASIVVVPIDSDCIQPAGISVYLEAMSIGKPTIVSRGPSTNGLIHDQAILVDRGDSNQLKDAILSLTENKNLRDEISQKGKEYALSLGGIERLINDLKKIIKKDFGN
jgi:glycosyltransferase involved in cell wall biosynthesis